jgi:molybdate transport system regulatory protein
MASRLPVDLHHALGHASTDKRLEILRRVGACGSISEAARAAGVSYKAAWQAVEMLSSLAGTPLVERAVGGRGGGGAVLTPAGHELLQAAARLEQARHAVLEQIARSRSADAATGGPGLAALGLRTSMRNALPCRVTAVHAQGGAVTVTLAAAGGDRLGSRVTRESAQLLDLVPGREVLALFKATAVDMLPAGAEAGGRNAIGGEVVRASRARGGGEVALRSAGGHSVVGFADPALAGGSGLRIGARALAVFDAAAVVVALAD